MISLSLSVGDIPQTFIVAVIEPLLDPAVLAAPSHLQRNNLREEFQSGFRVMV